MKLKYSSLLFVILLLTTVSTSSAAPEDLTGISREFTMTTSVDLTTSDGTYSHSLSEVVDISIQFADKYDDSEIKAVITLEQENDISWDYESGGFNTIDRYVGISSISHFTLEIPTDNSVGLTISNVPFVVGDPVGIIEDAVETYSDDPEITELESDELSFTYVQETENTDSDYLPEEERSQELRFTTELFIGFSPSGLIDSYSLEHTVVFGELTIIDFSQDLRSGISRLVSNAVVSPVFYGVIALLVTVLILFYNKYKE